MWILCPAEDSLETSSLIFSEKKNEKNIYKCCLLQSWLVPKKLRVNNFTFCMFWVDTLFFFQETLKCVFFCFFFKSAMECFFFFFFFWNKPWNAVSCLTPMCHKTELNQKIQVYATNIPPPPKKKKLYLCLTYAGLRWDKNDENQDLS